VGIDRILQVNKEDYDDEDAAVDPDYGANEDD
jgi:hypothetical protein